MKICLFNLGWNLKHGSFAPDFSVYFFIHLFLHNLCVLNSNLSDNILYLVTFTFKLAKHKMATKMLRKPHIFYIPAVRLTCIACFSPISRSIINRFQWNFARTIFESRGDYREIFKHKYYVVQKLDHLTCSKFEITTSLYKPIKLVKLKFVSPELHYMLFVIQYFPMKISQ